MQNSKRRSRLSHHCARGKKHSVLQFLLAGHHEHNCNLRRQNRTTEHQGISSLDNSASRFYIGLPNLLQFHVPLCSDSNCLWLRSTTLHSWRNPMMVNNGVEKERQKHLIRADCLLQGRRITISYFCPFRARTNCLADSKYLFIYMYQAAKKGFMLS